MCYSLLLFIFHIRQGSLMSHERHIQTCAPDRSLSKRYALRSKATAALHEARKSRLHRGRGTLCVLYT